MSIASVEQAFIADYEKAKSFLSEEAKQFIALSEKLPAILAVAAKDAPELESVVSLLNPEYAKVIETAMQALSAIAHVGVDAGQVVAGGFVNVPVDQQLINDAKATLAFLESLKK